MLGEHLFKLIYRFLKYVWIKSLKDSHLLKGKKNGFFLLFCQGKKKLSHKGI